MMSGRGKYSETKFKKRLEGTEIENDWKGVAVGLFETDT